MHAQMRAIYSHHFSWIISTSCGRSAWYPEEGGKTKEARDKDGQRQRWPEDCDRSSLATKGYCCDPLPHPESVYPFLCKTLHLCLDRALEKAAWKQKQSSHGWMFAVIITIPGSSCPGFTYLALFAIPSHVPAGESGDTKLYGLLLFHSAFSFSPRHFFGRAEGSGNASGSSSV